MVHPDEVDARLDRLFAQIDEACEHAEAKRASLIEAIAHEIESLLKTVPCIRGRYALAYAWYFHPRRRDSDEIRRRVDTLLLSVTGEDARHFLGWLYLGHNSYDFKEYPVALHYFEHAIAASPGGYFGLKAHEMALCCVVRMQGLAPALPRFARFVEIAAKHPKEDIWPRELARAFEETVGPVPASEYASLERLCRRLDEVGHLGDWFTSVGNRWRPVQ